MKQNFLMDVDGVCVDWIGGFGQFAESKGFKLRMPTPTTWEMNEWFGADDKTIRALITEFNGKETFANIPVFEDAKQYLPELCKYFNLVAITCCSSDPLTVSRRKKNLEALGVEFKAVHCLNFNESKSDLLKSYEPTFWVEDRVEGAETGHKAGHQTFLRNTTYNQTCNNSEIIRVKNWADILKIVLEQRVDAKKILELA
jgi:uncharacterized HAD superfamily protein